MLEKLLGLAPEAVPTLSSLAFLASEEAGGVVSGLDAGDLLPRPFPLPFLVGVEPVERGVLGLGVGAIGVGVGGIGDIGGMAKEFLPTPPVLGQ